ncbi:MAG: ABC transporter permease [Cellvibrionaceae bacterium]
MKILAASLVLAVAVVTAITVFANRMDQSLVRQSNSYLAADRVVQGRFVVPEEWRQETKNYSLSYTDVAEFSSMIFAKKPANEDSEEMQLASIKAVGSNYPLRGDVQISEVPFATGEDVYTANSIPSPGEVWVDSRVLPLMNLSLGDKITIGNRDLLIKQLIIREPDATLSFSALGPRVIMNIKDLDSTEVILPGSRVTYRLLVAGEENDLNRFENWLKPQLGDHHRIVELKQVQQNIGSALNRGARFLMLSGLIGVLLAGVAISISAQQFADRHIDQVALLKSLGATARQVRNIYIVQLIFLGFFSSIIGVFLGELIQRLITSSIASLFKVELLSASLFSYTAGIITGFLCLLCFALPPLWNLPKISPLKILRRELTISPVSLWLRGLLGITAIVLLIWFYSGDTALTLAIVFGLSTIIMIAGLVTVFLLNSSRRLSKHVGNIWRLASSNLLRYKNQTITQVLVFSCALMLLMVLFSVRTSLLDEWRLQLPENTPNHFILNIAPYERKPVQSLLDKSDLVTSPMYPMVLGRLVGVNQTVYQEKDRHLSNALRRELNLSWSQEMAIDNKLIAGQWWDSWESTSSIHGVSVEQDTAEELGLKIGDIVQFSLGGLALEAEVASIRSVDWNAMTPNFYFLFSPGALGNYSPNYLTSAYISPQDKTIINQLLRRYPTVVVLEVDRIIERIQSIVTQVSRGIELVLWLVLIGGMMVLVAAVNASMGNRLQEAGVLRALGSSKKLILGSLLVEFSLLGLLAGLLAVFGAESLLLSLQYFVFNQSISPHYELWLIGPLSGAILIGFLGLMACRKVVVTPPSVVLRQAEG